MCLVCVIPVYVLCYVSCVLEVVYMWSVFLRYGMLCLSAWRMRFVKMSEKAASVSVVNYVYMCECYVDLDQPPHYVCFLSVRMVV